MDSQHLVEVVFQAGSMLIQQRAARQLPLRKRDLVSGPDSALLNIPGERDVEIQT